MGCSAGSIYSDAGGAPEENRFVADAILSDFVITVKERFTPKTGGEPVSTEGKGIDIYRREEDGSWKVARSIANSNVSSIALVTQGFTAR